MPSKVTLACSKLLASQNLSISFAESATAGRLAFEFSLTPESGKILKGAIVYYDATVKERLPKVQINLFKNTHLNQPKSLVKMLKFMPIIIPADIHVAVMGLTATGGSETSEKPVGTIFMEIRFNRYRVGIREVYSGSPLMIVMKTVNRIASEIIHLINEYISDHIIPITAR